MESPHVNQFHTLELVMIDSIETFNCALVTVIEKN